MTVDLLSEYSQPIATTADSSDLLPLFFNGLAV